MLFPKRLSLIPIYLYKGINNQNRKKFFAYTLSVVKQPQNICSFTFDKSAVHSFTFDKTQVLFLSNSYVLALPSLHKEMSLI